MSNPMNPLHELPDALLKTLGRKDRLDGLLKAFAATRDAVNVEPVQANDPARIMLVGEGLTVACHQLDAAEDVWGVENFTLQTGVSAAGVWPGPWPESLPAEKTTRDLARELWGVPGFSTGPLAYFKVRGPQEEHWGLTCLFDTRAALESLTLIRLEDWQPLTPASNDAENVPAAEPSPIATPVASVAPAITCRSADLVPKTGWYEGRLPSDHPDHDYFSQSSGRYVYMHEGQRMLTLGVCPAANESLVLWTWLRDK